MAGIMDTLCTCVGYVKIACAALSLHLFRLVNAPPPLGPRPRLAVVSVAPITCLEEFLCEVTKVHQAFSAEVVVVIAEIPTTALTCLVLTSNIRYFFNFFLYPGYLGINLLEGWGNVRLFALQDLRYIFTSPPWEVVDRECDAVVFLNDRHSQDPQRIDKQVVEVCVKLRLVLPDTRFVVQVLEKDSVCSLRRILGPRDSIVCLEELTAYLLQANTSAQGTASVLTSLLCLPDTQILKSVVHVPDPPMWRRFTGWKHFRLLSSDVTNESGSFWNLALRCYLGCQAILLGYRKGQYIHLLPETVPDGSYLIYFGDLLSRMHFLDESDIMEANLANEDHPQRHVTMVPNGHLEALARCRGVAVNGVCRHGPQDPTPLVVCPLTGVPIETTVADYYRTLSQFIGVDSKPNISVSMWSVADTEETAQHCVDPAIHVLATATAGHNKSLYDAWVSLLQDLDILQVDITSNCCFWQVFQQQLKRGLVAWALLTRDARLVPAPHCNHKLRRGDAVLVFFRKLL